MCPSQADEAAIQPDPRVRAPQRGELLGRSPQGQEDGEQDQTEQVSHNHNISLGQHIFEQFLPIFSRGGLRSDISLAFKTGQSRSGPQKKQLFRIHSASATMP